MIFHWINSIARFLQWFFLPPIPQEVAPIIDLNAPCPWCGHRGKCIIRAVPAIANTPASRAKIVRHCEVCQGDSEEKPVIEGGGTILPAMAAAPPPMN